MKPQFFGDNREVLLETDFDLDRLLVFLPGMSGKAHSGRFAWLAEAAEARGIGCARLALWEGEESLKKLSLTDIFSTLDTIFAELAARNYQEVVLVGKSFGGAVALGYQHSLVVQKVLWAPAIGTAPGDGNFASRQHEPLGTIPNLLDITLGTETLATQTSPVTIIHGTADPVIPLTNSEVLVQALPHAVLEVIEGADHSFSEEAHEQALRETTTKLL